MPTQNALSTSTTVTPITADHPKGCKATELFRAQYNKAGLDDDSAQFLNENPEFPAALAKVIKKYAITNQYASEEVSSNGGYPSKFKVKQIVEQVQFWKKMFPELAITSTLLYIQQTLPALTLPAWADGWFAIPVWQKLAETYSAALQKILDQIKKSRQFYNYWDGQIDEQHIRQLEATAKAFEKIRETQDGDVLIIPAQLGIRHRGRSVRRALVVMGKAEFGLGAFAVGSILLTHPERLEKYEDLVIDCAGDQFSPDADGKFPDAPYLYFHDSKVKFGSGLVDSAYVYCGSASGGFPQS